MTLPGFHLRPTQNCCSRHANERPRGLDGGSAWAQLRGRISQGQGTCPPRGPGCGPDSDTGWHISTGSSLERPAVGLTGVGSPYCRVGLLHRRESRPVRPGTAAPTWWRRRCGSGPTATGPTAYQVPHRPEVASEGWSRLQTGSPLKGRHVIGTCGLRRADDAVSPEQHKGLGTTEGKLVGAGPARRHSVTAGRLWLPVKLKTRAVSQQLGPVPASLQVRQAFHAHLRLRRASCLPLTGTLGLRLGSTRTTEENPPVLICQSLWSCVGAYL